MVYDFTAPLGLDFARIVDAGYLVLDGAGGVGDLVLMFDMMASRSELRLGHHHLISKRERAAHSTISYRHSLHSYVEIFQSYMFASISPVKFPDYFKQMLRLSATVAGTETCQLSLECFIIYVATSIFY